jgi:hypothetical protein
MQDRDECRAALPRKRGAEIEHCAVVGNIRKRVGKDQRCRRRNLRRVIEHECSQGLSHGPVTGIAALEQALIRIDERVVVQKPAAQELCQ